MEITFVLYVAVIGWVLIFIGLLRKGSIKETYRKVRLFELEDALKAYTELPAPIQSLSIRYNVLSAGLEFYMEGNIAGMRPELVAYSDGVEVFRNFLHSNRLCTDDPTYVERLGLLLNKHKLSPMTPYLYFSFREGKDHYTLGQFREALRSANKIKVCKKEYNSRDGFTELTVTDTGFVLKLKTYAECIIIPKDAIVQCDSRTFDFRHLFIELNNGEFR